MTRTFAILAIVVAALGMAVMWYVGRTSGSAFAQCSGSTVAGGDIGGPFELVNSQGQTVTDADVITEPALVYFGYTYCPDACPFDVSRNVDAVDILSDRGISTLPVFITIDPDRDTVDVMADYEYNVHDRLVALTGSAAQIDAASKAYKTYYKSHKDGTDDYLVDHSTFTYLVLPELGFVEFFRRDLTAEQMADRTQCFIENS